MLDLHPNWMLLEVNICNAFSFVSQKTNFQELWSSIDTLD
jgi:hypothetical protein